MGPATKMNKKIILKWTLLPFIVVAIYIGVPAALFMLFYFQSIIFGTNIDAYNIFLQILAHGMAAYLAVATGSYIAPTHKIIVAIAVYALVLLLIGISFGRNVETNDIWKLGNMLAQLFAGGYAVWLTSNNTEKI
jgi:hypothetical protein